MNARHAGSAALQLTLVSLSAYLCGLYFTRLFHGPSAATGGLCFVLRIPAHAQLAALAVAVVMVVSSLHPTLDPLVNATLRFGEACIGTALAVFAMLLWPDRRP